MNIVKKNSDRFPLAGKRFSRSVSMTKAVIGPPYLFLHCQVRVERSIVNFTEYQNTDIAYAPSIRSLKHHGISEHKSIEHAPLDDKSAKKCTVSITKFLATSMQPYCLVEEMVHTLNHRYRLPSRKFFSHTAMPKLYVQAIEKLKEILPKACLSCTFFQENHTAENIREAINSKLIDWDLNPNCAVSCTTDNGANIVNSIKLLSIEHVPCFAHCINIGVNRAIEVPQIKKAVGRLKSLQNAVAHSWKMQRDLRAAQELLQCDVTSLPSTCPTRWWSTLKLCKRFLENQLSLCKMFQNFADKKHLMPEGSEITALENFVQVTSILQDVTENLTGENYVTSSTVLPLIRQIKKKLKVEETDTSLLTVLKEKCLSSLQKYEGDPLKTLLSKSTFLDPRFRLHFFYDDAKEGVKESIINDLKDKFNSSESPSEIFDKSPPKKKQKGLSALFEEEVFESIEVTPIERIKKEIEKYLCMPAIGLDDDPLQWWKQYGRSFPQLCTIVK